MNLSSNRSDAALTAGLVILLVALLLPVPAPAATSSQPWKIELLAGVFLLIAPLVWMRSRNADTFRSTPRPIAIPLCVFVVWSGLSAMWARFPALTVHHTLLWAAYTLVLVILYSHLRSKGSVTVITTSFTVTALVIGAVCALDYLTLVDFASVEGAIRQRYAKFAEMLITILPVLWVVPLYARRRRAFWLSFVTANLAWIAVMLSLSKGAFLAGIGAMVIVFAGLALFSMPSLRKRVAAFAGVWMTITLVVQAFFTLFSTAPSTSDYLTGNTGNAALSSQIRVLTWRIAGTMVMHHPIFGVGADNFGVRVNDARAKLPQNAAPQREIAEDLALERAHNEPLQILAELGIIGLILSLLPFVVFAWLVIKRLRRDGRLSPMLWAATAGMIAFFASSLVSSFSFRAAQNGIAFMMVFALGIYELTKRSRPEPSGARWRWVSIASVVVGGAMVAWSGAKAASEYYVYQTQSIREIGAVEPLYTKALALDPQNANAYLALGTRYAREGRHAEAAEAIRASIDRGLGVTLTYSLLAKQQRLAGDTPAAERTFAEGLSIFPGSVFLRVDHALFLEQIGKPNEAAGEMRIARAIDLRQANGWYALIRDGSTAAFYRARSEPETAPPAELWPDNAVRQYLD